MGDGVDTYTVMTTRAPAVLKKKDFLPQNDQIWPKIGIFGQLGPGHADLFGALLVSRLVVVARGLYLARHLFTLS